MTIKRHHALQPLSRDHLIALLHSYRLVQSAAGHPRFELQKSIADFNAAWKDEIATHFAHEERLFLSLTVSEASLHRLFEDHAALRELVLQLHFSPTADAAKALGQRLEEHVRWEEHELFPEIEEHWTPQQLQELQEATEKIETLRGR